MYNNKKLSVIVPAYNEELLIGPTLQTVPDYIDKVYVVDDNSSDQTYEIVNKYAKTDPRIIPLKHESNRGVGAGIVTGYKKSIEDEIDIIIVMAGDNQMDPTYIPAIVDPIIEDRADYTKGNRLLSIKNMKGMSYFRRLGNFLLTALTKISSGYWNIGDPQNGYTAISSKALREIDLNKVYPSYGYCNDLLAKLNVGNFRVLDVNIPARYGNEKSKIRYTSYIFKVSGLLLRNFFWRIKTKYFIRGINPIALFYTLGFSLLFSGIILDIVLIYLKVIGNDQLAILGLNLPFCYFIGGFSVILAILLDFQKTNQFKISTRARTVTSY